MDQQVVDISPPFSACSQDTGATWPVVDPCQGGPSVQPGAAGLAHTHFLGEQQMHPWDDFSQFRSLCRWLQNPIPGDLLGPHGLTILVILHKSGLLGTATLACVMLQALFL